MSTQRKLTRGDVSPGINQSSFREVSRKRIRVYCPFMPYPITEGAYQIMFDQVRVLSLANAVELVTWKESPLQIAQKLQGQDPFDGRVKIISWGAAESTKESQSERAVRTLTSFFSEVPSPAAYYYPEGSDRRQELGPCDLEIYHYSYAWNWLKNPVSPKSNQRVLHLHNLESDLFLLRAEKETKSVYRWIHRVNARKLAVLEAHLPSLVDQLWFVSEPDRNDYEKRFGLDLKKASVKPPTYSKEIYELRRSRFLKYQTENALSKPRLGFVGTLDFDPNIMSLDWILDSVCPLLSENSWDGELVVVGRNASEAQKAKMARYPFVRYLGFVQSMESFWESLSLFLVPHIEGSGVRVKLLDAVASGVPVLANAAATERIDEKVLSSPLVTVAETPAKWLDLIVSLNAAELRLRQSREAIHPALLGENVYGDYL